MEFDSQELTTKVLTSLIEDSVKTGWSKVKKFFKDLDAKDSIYFQTAYEKYLKSMVQKYSKIKTIIYRRVPKDIYSFYVHTGIWYNGKIFDMHSVVNLLKIGNKIIITGTGGIGKSLLFKHLFLNTIDNTDYIPVLIELRSFNILEAKECFLFDVLYNTLCDNGFRLEREYFEYSLEEGGYVFFLDGYDEINHEKQMLISKEIQSFSDKYNSNRFIVSSRQMDEFIGWNDFCEAEMMRLTKSEALELIDKIEFDETAKKTFYEELNNSLFDKYESFASNPLLLNIMLLTFQKHASIPDRLNDFYDEAFVTLFNAHDATKDAFVRDIRSELGCEDFKLVFAYICFKSYFRNEFQFSDAEIQDYIAKAKEKFDRLDFEIQAFQDDLTTSVCMLIKEGLEYHFAHRSFQEYFAAWYTCKLTDDIQAKLLHKWIEESDRVMTDEYFSMLYDLQSEKVNLIILCPIIREIKKLYDKAGFSISFLRNLFSGVNITHKEINEVDNNSISLKIFNRYLCYGCMLTDRLNGYPYESANQDEEAEIYNRIFEELRKDKENKRQYTGRYYFTFDEILRLISENELLVLLNWFQKQLLFAFQILEKSEGHAIGRKKKISTILDEL